MSKDKYSFTTRQQNSISVIKKGRFLLVHYEVAGKARGEKMIGAVVFVIAFVLFTVISLVISLPPGSWVVQELIPDLQGAQYESLVTGIINGVIYGVIIWILYSLVKMVYDRRKGPQRIVVEAEVKK